MSPLVKKLFVSLAYGVGALSGVLTAALADGVVSGDEWAALASAFFVAFWGKFSSNTTVIAASRTGETISGPKQG
jgi:H+/Cl- antiporter ClcA